MPKNCSPSNSPSPERLRRQPEPPAAESESEEEDQFSTARPSAPKPAPAPGKTAPEKTAPVEAAPEEAVVEDKPPADEAPVEKPPETAKDDANGEEEDEDEEESGEHGVVTTLNQPSSDLSVISAPNPSVMSDANAATTATATSTASATVPDSAVSAPDEPKKRKSPAATVKGLMRQNKIVASTNGGGEEVVSTTSNAPSARPADEAEDDADAGDESAPMATGTKARKRASSAGTAAGSGEDAGGGKKRRKAPKTQSDWTVDTVNTNDAEIRAKLASGETRLFLWSLISSQKETKKMVASYSSNPEMGIAFPSVCGLEPYIRHSTATPLPMTIAQFSKLIKPQNALLEHYTALQKSGSPEAHAIRAAIWYADLRTEQEFDAGEVPKKTILALLCCKLADAPSGTEPLALMIVERVLVHTMWKDESSLPTQTQTVPVSLRSLLARHPGFQDKKVSLKVLLDRKCKGLTTKIDLAQFGQAVETTDVDDETGASDGDADADGDGDGDGDGDALDGDGDEGVPEGDGADNSNKEEGAPEGDDGSTEPSGGSVSTTPTAPLASRRPLPQTYSAPAQEIQMSYKRPFDWTLPISLDPNFESVHVTISFSKPKRARSA